MNYSKQREVVYEYVKNSHIHPTADKVYREVKKILPNISFSTVYRNLNQLVEKDLIKKISLDGEKYIYDDIAEKHIHFFCNQCGILEDTFIENDIFEMVQSKIEHEVDSIEIVVKGICKNCKEG